MAYTTEANKPEHDHSTHPNVLTSVFGCKTSGNIETIVMHFSRFYHVMIRKLRNIENFRALQAYKTFLTAPSYSLVNNSLTESSSH